MTPRLLLILIGALAVSGIVSMVTPWGLIAVFVFATLSAYGAMTVAAETKR